MKSDWKVYVESDVAMLLLQRSPVARIRYAESGIPSPYSYRADVHAAPCLGT